MRPPKLARAAFAAAFAFAGAADAAVFVVNNNGDGVGNPTNCQAIDRGSPPDLSTLPTTCRLRDAVAAANALSGADEIVISLAGDVTVTLLDTLVVDESLDINAAPLTGQTIFASFTLRAQAGVDDLLRVTDGETTLSRLRLTLADIDIMAGNLVFDQVENGSFDETITGAGSLTKDGTATLALNGTNDYTGGTIVSQGTLQVDTDSLPGDVEIETGARLVFDQAANDDFAGEISGAGTLEKTGTGTLNLTTANTFDGSITITQGTLQGFVGAGGSSLNGNIIDNAKLVFMQAGAGTFADNISGSGSVEKDGPGDLTLDGTNTFTGGLTIKQGKVIGKAASIPGNVVLAAVAGTQLVFDQGTTAGTHGGSISGGTAGGISLVKRGTAKLTLTGSNSFLGDTSVEQGELEGSAASLPGNVILGGAGTTVSFNQAGNGTYDDVISGTGNLVKRGGGSLSLTDVQTFVGSTTIEAGTLSLGGSAELPGNVTVQSPGTLAGTGEVVGTVTANGTVSPGGSGTGTLQVGGIDFGASSVLAVSVADAGSDLLQVNGAATIANGARVDVTLGNVALVETTKTILTSEGAQPANQFLIDEDFAFFDSEVVFLDTNDIGIHLTPNGDTPVTLAQTPNQRAVAMALEQALAAPHEPDLDTVATAINGLQGEELPQALADMSGEQLTEFATARLAISDRFQNSLHERIRGVAWRDGEGLISQRESDAGVFAANPLAGRMLPGIGQAGPWPIAVAGQSMSSILDSSDAFSPAPGELGVGGWIDGYGLLGTLEGDSGAVDLDYLIGGVSLGMDYRFHPNWLIGIAGGYAHTELDFDELSGNQSAETGQGAVYLGYVTPWLQIGGSGRFGYSAMTTTRDIEFSTISRDTDADFDGIDGGARLDAALDLFEVRGVELQPLASFSYTHVQQDEIDESGADTLDLTGDEEEVDSIVSGLGARVHGVIEIDDELWFHPEFRARWNHEFGDTERELSSVRIGGQPGAVFKVSGAEFPSDTGVLGVSWTLVAAGRLHAFIDYDVTLASELIQHGVAVGAKFVW